MPFETDTQISLPPSAIDFHPKLLALMEHDLRGTGIEINEVLIPPFPDGSPLIKVTEAKNTLLIFFYGGENWRQAYSEIGHIGSALTINPDLAGPNTDRLGIYLPYMEARQDQRTRKPIPDSVETSIVKNQGVNTIALAREIGLVARARYVATQDLHNHYAAQQLVEESNFRPEGPIEHINFTSVPLYADYIVHLLDDPTEWTIGGTDLGDLNRQSSLQRYLKEDHRKDISLVIIKKKRISTEDGTDSITNPQLIYGNPQGKRVLLVDDVISSGGTLRENVDLYSRLGAAEIHIFAPQALFVPETYYSTIRHVLADPIVASIVVTDILPIRKRLGKIRDIPYIGKLSQEKIVEVIDVSPMFNAIVRTLATTSTMTEVRNELGYYVWDIQDPRLLFEQITGTSLPEGQIGGIYKGQGKYDLFPKFANVYENPIPLHS